MILPFTVRLNKGSFTMTIPKSMGLHLQLDKLLDDDNITTRLIAEEVKTGILIRCPTLEERERFDTIKIP